MSRCVDADAGALACGHVSRTACRAWPSSCVAELLGDRGVGAAAAAKPALTVLLSLATARAACEGLYDLTGTRGLQTAAGVVAMLVVVVSVYGGLALLLEDTRGHLVLPTGRRGRARGVPRGRPRCAAGVAGVRGGRAQPALSPVPLAGAGELRAQQGPACLSTPGRATTPVEQWWHRTCARPPGHAADHHRVAEEQP